MLVTSIIMPFLMDIKPGVGASVVADLKNFVRNILAAIGTVLSPIGVSNIGFGWWMTILALLCSLAVLLIVIVIWKEGTEKKPASECVV